MTRLQKQHPDAYRHLRNGAFSVQLNEDNKSASIPVGQTVEETVNKDTQTAGGTKSFSVKPSAVSRYYLTAEYRIISLQELRCLLNLPGVVGDHPDLLTSHFTI